MAWAMLTLKRWALTLCIFVQGMNAIVRFLILFPSGNDRWQPQLAVYYHEFIGDCHVKRYSVRHRSTQSSGSLYSLDEVI